MALSIQLALTILCSSDCGTGKQERLVFCGRKVGDSLPERHCSKARKPEATKQCDNGECQLVWVTGSWGECSVNCGNGTQTRVVFCAGLVGGMYQEFPDEVCPRSASQSRSVICMNSNGQHSDSCESRERPVHWRKCNSPACPVAHRQPHNCEDNYGKSICHYVVQANFCRYPHYGKMCCGSCLKRRLRKH